jgi:hypothetical protein
VGPSEEVPSWEDPFCFLLSRTDLDAWTQI